MKSAILLVDDEPNVLSALKRSLFEEPYDIVTAANGEAALQAIAVQQFKVIVSDERMPGMDGATFLAETKKRSPASVRFMLTGHASLEATMLAINRGEIYRFFTKPWNDEELKLAIRNAIEKYDLEEENRRLLKTVKRQSREIRYLEASYPGIAEVTRDQQGALLLPEISDEEIRQLIDSYCEES